MPIEVRRFGVGHRRPEGPPGTTGIAGQVIHSDGRGVISELVFARHGAITPHANPGTTWLVVIEGGGWVQVGADRARVQAGEAILWPPDVPHAAWTDGTPMRAIVVELAPPSPAAIVEGTSRALAPGRSSARGTGSLAPRTPDPTHARDPAASEGEPW